MSDLPTVELYSIGTELLMGQIQDSNVILTHNSPPRFRKLNLQDVRRIGISDHRRGEQA